MFHRIHFWGHQTASQVDCAKTYKAYQLPNQACEFVSSYWNGTHQRVRLRNKKL